MGIQVDANPTKQFFVSSLTRDIELVDAILDLLDNCVDGIMRTNQGKEVKEDTPYETYFAKITANPKEFVIEDNCGGITKEDAIHKAFKFGRPNTDVDSKIPTVGMYGIGMKRALFKLGKSSLVESASKPDKYMVSITEEWLDKEGEWYLDLIEEEYKENQIDGTHIIVEKLHDQISKQFDPSQSKFLDNLYLTISQNFALIIRKGFRIFLNEIEITPISLSLLSTKDFAGDVDSIAPYMYSGSFGDVNVEIAIGFYSELSAIDEGEEDSEVERTRSNAGITVICNDRVVLHRDKTFITGWGNSPVPNFHNQFISIAGLMIFSSNSSELLPLTTTKRGIDLSAPIYWEALEYCKKGLKKFTDFTNKWKGREQEIASAFEAATLVETIHFLKQEKKNLKKVPRTENEYQFIPRLPQPERDRKNVRISFLKSKEEIDELRSFYYPDEDKTANELGSWCFDQLLNRAKE